MTARWPYRQGPPTPGRNLEAQRRTHGPHKRRARPARRHGGAAVSGELSPAERSLRARAAAYRLHSLYDSRQLTANARAAFSDRFARQVDPDGVLPEAERRRRAECARKAYFAQLAVRSAQARRSRRQARPGPRADSDPGTAG